MYSFILSNYDSSGALVTTSWQFTPVDREPGFDINRSDTLRATGVSGGRGFFIKEVWQITIGAATLLVDSHRENFLRLVTSDIIWQRKLGSRKLETEFVLETDKRVMFEYLQDKRSLKRKTFTLVEKQANYYDQFDEFYDRYLALIKDNALW